MALVTFGVDAESVRRRYFPALNAFSTQSAPTVATVGDWIDEEAAALQGQLLGEAIPADALTAGTAPYINCATQLRRKVALKCLEVMTGRFPELAKRLAEEAEDWDDGFEEGGATFLGDDSLATLSESEPDGPTTHIDEYNLDVGDTSDASDVIPALRRSDQL